MALIIFGGQTYQAIGALLGLGFPLLGYIVWCWFDDKRFHQLCGDCKMEFWSGKPRPAQEQSA